MSERSCQRTTFREEGTLTDPSETILGAEAAAAGSGPGLGTTREEYDGVVKKRRITKETQKRVVDEISNVWY